MRLTLYILSPWLLACATDAYSPSEAERLDEAGRTLEQLLSVGEHHYYAETDGVIDYLNLHITGDSDRAAYFKIYSGGYFVNSGRLDSVVPLENGTYQGSTSTDNQSNEYEYCTQDFLFANEDSVALSAQGECTWDLPETYAQNYQRSEVPTPREPGSYSYSGWDESLSLTIEVSQETMSFSLGALTGGLEPMGKDGHHWSWAPPREAGCHLEFTFTKSPYRAPQWEVEVREFGDCQIVRPANVNDVSGTYR